MSLPSFTAAARRVAPAARCARLAAARGLASVMAPAGDERDIERDVAVAQEKAREARENPCVDVPFGDRRPARHRAAGGAHAQQRAGCGARQGVARRRRACQG